MGADYRFCISSAINAGIDMVSHNIHLHKLAFRCCIYSIVDRVRIQVMVPFGYQKYLQELAHLVESKEIPLSRIDDAVERILRVKFVAGIFEYPYSDRSLLDTVGCKVCLL